MFSELGYILVNFLLNVIITEGTVAYTSVTFYKVPEQHGHVYLVGLYLSELFAQSLRDPVLKSSMLKMVYCIDKIVNLDRLEYIFTRLRSPGRN